MIQQNKVAFDFINYLTIEALEDGVTILFTNDIEYGIDGCGWVYLPKNTYTPSFKSGQLISFRGNLTPEIYSGIGTFTISKKCNLKGNCMSLLFGDNAADKFSLSGKDYSFCTLFEGCTTIISVSDDFLPATTLARLCYYRMFYGCTSLTTAPELPATTLASACYQVMFYDCTKLNYIKMLATDISASGCLSNWVKGVASTGTFVKNKNATWNKTGVSGVPSGWTIQKV